MPEFPHLPLPIKYSGQYKHKGQKIEKILSQITEQNRLSRRSHGRTLKQATNSLIQQWQDILEDRQQNELPNLLNTESIPIFLKVDTDLFKPDNLYSFGIEVIAEENDGYIIGASSDSFTSLKAKIDKFILNQGKFKNKASELWEIAIGEKWRLDYILSDELNAKWDTISPTEELIVDVSIACALKISDAPSITKNETKKHFEQRYQKWLVRKENSEVLRDELEMKRQDEFDSFLSSYPKEAERLDSFVSYEDSFGCRIKASGKVLKDLVRTYQYLFDVTEYDTLKYISPFTGEEENITLDVIEPHAGSSRICIIDSGIQEAHALLSQAVEEEKSICYIPGETSTSDLVGNGGHGTKVTGAVLFANQIPKEGSYQLDTFIQNARILNHRKICPSSLYPPLLMEQIVDDFLECRIFNLSVNSNRACRIVHMSQWATTIDQLMLQKNKLFIISTGNINSSNSSSANPGIKEHIARGRYYPEYLLTDASRIANPAQSCFALTVGSVCCNEYEDEDLTSFGKKDDPSAFTRTGPGLWSMIKPDVVEYGGDFIMEKNSNPNISVKPITSIEVVRTTTTGGNAVGYDVGTSYAAPKVSYIAGKILNIIPSATPNLLRALIAQSARLPRERFRSPRHNDLRFFGYGIPDIDRATHNSKNRITLTAESKISAKQAHIYTVAIPHNIRSAGNEFDILMEVTLSYMAKPRRTRRKTFSYLSTWLDWKSSKFGETYRQFKTRVTKYVQGDDTIEETDSDEHIQWSIRENVQWGSVKRYKRQDSTLQKDWAILKAYNLPEELSIAVIGHKGWEKDIFSEVSYSIAVSFEVLNEEIDIYNPIRVENNIEIEQEIS